MYTAVAKDYDFEKYKKTEEYKTLYARHKKLADAGDVALIELIPCHKLNFGGYTIFDDVIRDRHKNPVIDQRTRADGLGIGPVGATWRLDKEDDLKYIYCVFHSPIVRTRLVFEGEEARKKDHQFRVIDAHKSSIEYAETRQEDIIYQNKIFTYEEGIVNFLCMYMNRSTSKPRIQKQTDLSQIWENGRIHKTGEAEANRKKLKAIMDSPDMDYYIVAYNALAEGDAAKETGFYKTAHGTYKHNASIIGNSIDAVIGYLKSNDEVYITLKKGTSLKAAGPKPK